MKTSRDMAIRKETHFILTLNSKVLPNVCPCQAKGHLLSRPCDYGRSFYPKSSRQTLLKSVFWLFGSNTAASTKILVPAFPARPLSAPSLWVAQLPYPRAPGMTRFKCKHTRRHQEPNLAQSPESLTGLACATVWEETFSSQRKSQICVFLIQIKATNHTGLDYWGTEQLHFSFKWSKLQALSLQNYSKPPPKDFPTA